MTAASDLAIFEKYFPKAAVFYTYQLWQKYRFQFKITRHRKTKLGDYRFDPRKKKHYVTVNHNLNTYAFLITYIHEVAHLVAFLNHKSKIAPHGEEWKETFRDLMKPVMNLQVFPTELYSSLLNHMINPKATVYADSTLMRILRTFDPQSSKIHLEDIEIGSHFMFKERIFEKKLLRRTRVLCKELSSGKKYLISKMAMVDKVEKE